VIERQRTAALIGVAGVVTAAAPIVLNFRSAPRDSFPLSHYPMFSAARPNVLDVTHLVGRTGDGQRIGLPCSLLGPGGMNQHRKQVRRAALRGRGDPLVRRAARRVARRPLYAEVVAVELVTCGYRLVDWFDGTARPVSETVHATASVDRVPV